MSTIHRTRLVHAILLALVASPCAQAQQAPATPDSQSSTLETIIVTAEKRSEDIQNVPMSIGVIDEAQTRKHARDAADRYRAVHAGIHRHRRRLAGAGDRSALRGISPLSAGSTVATYIDETPLGTSSNYGARLDRRARSAAVRFPERRSSARPAGHAVRRQLARRRGALRDEAARSRHSVVARSARMSSVNRGGGDLGYRRARFGFNAPIVARTSSRSARASRVRIRPATPTTCAPARRIRTIYWQQAAHATLLWKAERGFVGRSVRRSSRSTSTPQQLSHTALDPVSLKPLYGDLKDDNYVPEPYQRRRRLLQPRP